MKYKWLNSKNNQKLIVFFNGWGMDECVVRNLNPQDYDILMFFDYNNLETDFDFKKLVHFSEKYLVAWSMGVMIATLFDINYNSKTAINGTLKPIDDNFGIPHKIYNLNEKHFSPEGAEKFLKNMYNNNTEFCKPQREFENQQSELTALKDYRANNNFIYDKVIISDNDKIIPTKNQVAYWNISPNIQAGHAPFEKFRSWRELI